MDKTQLAAIRIILVEPAGALNVGSVARVMKNMGLQELVLVNPHCDPLGDEARQMAVHAVDILEQAQPVNTIPEALVGCQRAIATTARSRTLLTPLQSPRIALPKLLTENFKSALIFGPEDRGLSNIELNYAQEFVCIPSNPEYPSLNLAQAVAVCAYELYQACQQPPITQTQTTQPLIPKDISPVPMEALEAYYQHLEALLLQIGYLYPHTAKARMEKLRRIYNRTTLSNEEVAMLRGILSQVEWALENSDSSKNKN